MTNKPFLVFEIQGRYALQRRLIRTEHGYFGLASHAMKIGDSVVLCKGSSVPLILRRRKEGNGLFQLIGDAYIHGIMRGEAFQDVKCKRLLIS
jgi:hypothetical protein